MNHWLVACWCVYSFILMCCSLDAVEYQSIVDSAQVTRVMQCKNSIITHITSPDTGKQFLLKQIRYEGKSTRLSKLCFEVVSLAMGHKIKVPLNQVCIIPANTSFPGKPYHVPVTLHELVPGIQFKYCRDSCYPQLTISQKYKKKPVGLTREVIYHMSRHRDLPAMVALDTFISNGGRGTQNYFYDKEHDAFWGIDTSSAFRYNLCNLSCQNIEAMLSDPATRLSKKEYDGLEKYYRAFKKLIRLYPAQLTCDLIDQAAEYAGFFSEYFYCATVQAASRRTLARGKKVVHESYTDALLLRKLIKKLLKQHAQ